MSHVWGTEEVQTWGDLRKIENVEDLDADGG